MEEVGAIDAEGRLEQLLDRVEAGEEIVITRSGRPVARLISSEPPRMSLGASKPKFDFEKAKAAADGIRAMSQGITLGGLDIKELINEGRR